MNHPELLKNTCFTLDNTFSEHLFLSQLNLNKSDMKKNLLFLLFNLLMVIGFAQDWSAVGNGTNGRVRAMIEFDGDLIVGGEFTEAGGQEAFNVARWDGSSWYAMGDGFAGEVYDFAIYGGSLYASGWFFNDPEFTQEYEGIARWIGSAWGPLPDYDPDSWGGEIYDMLVHNNELYITNHSAIGFDFITRVSKFNGSTWTDLPGEFIHNGNQGQIYTLGIYNNQIVAGGLFDEIDETDAKSVASFNGTAWESLNMPSDGLFDKVYKVLEYNGDLYTGGIFFNPFYTTMAKLSGEEWTLYQMDVDNNLWNIEDMYVFDDKLFVAGVFYYTEGSDIVAACCIFNETEEDYQWQSLNFFNENSTQWIGFSMAVYDGELYLGGDFQYAGSDNEPKNNVARFNGVIPTAIHENGNVLVDVDLYPNPVTSSLKIDLPGTDKYSVALYNTLGQLVINQKNNQGQLELDMNHLNSGFYYLYVNSKEGFYTEKIIKK
jgi:hypothetical protein